MPDPRDCLPHVLPRHILSLRVPLRVLSSRTFPDTCISTAGQRGSHRPCTQPEPSGLPAPQLQTQSPAGHGSLSNFTHQHIPGTLLLSTRPTCTHHHVPISLLLHVTSPPSPAATRRCTLEQVAADMCCCGDKSRVACHSSALHCPNLVSSIH